MTDNPHRGSPFDDYLEEEGILDEVNEAARIEACAAGGRMLASKHLVERLDPDDAAPFLEMSPRLTRDTWERFREHALPGVRAVDEEALKRLSARYVLDAVPEEAAPPFEGPALILTGREDHLVGYRDQAALLE